MPRLSAADRGRVEAAIRAAEDRTSGEIVAVVAESSGGYGFVRWGVPALAALVAPWLLRLVVPLGAVELLSAQLVVFAALATALQWPPLVHRLVPRSVQEANAGRAARAAFHDLGLADTTGRTGVLLFVAEAEHHVEILVDRGIADRIAAAAWQAVADRFVADLRRGRVVDGFERAIAACGDVLARDFPPAAGDRNELPDRPAER